MIDWSKIDQIISEHYTKGKSATGKLAYDELLLFKACLLQTWYGLSDYELEDRINDNLSFSYFYGMSIDQVSPDHSTISRFRSLMTKKGAYEALFKAINKQLEFHRIIVKTGALVDASIIDTPLKPKGSSKHKVLDQDKEEGSSVEQDSDQAVKKQIHLQLSLLLFLHLELPI